jgi:RimJ/RimL family protein N-acetyltransferase
MEAVRGEPPWMPWGRSDFTQEEMRPFLDESIAGFAARTMFRFAIVAADGRFLGGCGVVEMDGENQRANAGYWVRPSAQRKSVATSAIRQLAAWAFTNTDLVRLELLVAAGNVPSIRTAERAGAQREGVLRNRLVQRGVVHDAVVFSLVRPDRDAPHPTPQQHAPSRVDAIVPSRPIAIRAYERADAPAVYEALMESLPALQPFMPWARTDLTLAEQRAWVDAQVDARAAGTAYEFGIFDAGRRYLGGCGLNQLDRGERMNRANRRANLGYWVRSSAARQGVATAAIHQLVGWAFANTDLNRLEVVVAVENTASLRTAERAGAVREAVLRRRLMLYGVSHDAVVLSFLRGGAALCGPAADV